MLSTLQGWLSPFRLACGTNNSNVFFSRTMGLVDFAGSGNVHMTGKTLFLCLRELHFGIRIPLSCHVYMRESIAHSAVLNVGYPSMARAW